MESKNVPPEIPVRPVGIIRSCYREKFGIPRQAGLVPEAEGEILLLPPWNGPEAVRRLDEFSHAWILFLFHAVPPEAAQKATARPPRLGGNERVGVFASRSPFRPNRIGLSAVRILQVEPGRIRVAGGDFLDGTPVLDIKPYIPYADAFPKACAGYADAPPPASLPVHFTEDAEASLAELEGPDRTRLRRLITRILSLDPRPPASPSSPERLYGFRLFDLEIRWRCRKGDIEVLKIERIED